MNNKAAREIEKKLTDLIELIDKNGVTKSRLENYKSLLDIFGSELHTLPAEARKLDKNGKLIPWEEK